MKFLTALGLFYIVVFQFLRADADDSQRTEVCYKHGEQLELKCSQLAGEVEWEGENLEGAKNEVIDGHSVLRFEKGKPEHSGKYVCKNENHRQNFEAQMGAAIGKFPHSANVVEDEKYSLACEVHGTTDDIRIEWYKDEELVSPNNTIHEHVNSTKLIIHKIHPGDRGNYTCKATNKCGQTSRSIYIRVVDKYAALWPFLGICAEVVVLCAVIFIYEKRRSKAEFDESDGEQNDTKHVNAKDSDVRQRK